MISDSAKFRHCVYVLKNFMMYLPYYFGKPVSLLQFAV